MSSRVVWTDDLRRDLAPRDASQLRPIDTEKAWARLKQSFPSATVREPLVKGLEKAGAAREAMKAALEMLDAKAFPAGESAEVYGAALAMVEPLGHGDSLVSMIANAAGAAAATNALIVAHGLTVMRAHPQHWLVATNAQAPFGWRALRAAVLGHGATDVVELAREAWSRAPLPLKIVLAHAVPSAPELAAEAAREVAGLHASIRLVVTPILASLREKTHLLDVLLHRMSAKPLVDAVENLGLDALPALLVCWEGAVSDRLHLARATSCFEDDAAATILASELDKKTTREVARSYFLRLPELAARTLGPMAKGRTKIAVLASELHAQVERTGQRHDEASLDELPMVLASPPWIVGKPKRSLRPITIAARSRPEALRIPAQQRDAVVTQTGFQQFDVMSPEAAEAYAANVKAGELPLAWWSNRARVPREVLLEIVATVGVTQSTPAFFPYQALAVFGEQVLDAVIHWIEHAPYADIVRYPLDAWIDSHRLAVVMLDIANDPVLASRAWRYFDAHIEAALVGLIPVAVGKRGARRAVAERVLRKLAKADANAVRVVATSYGAQVAERVEEILTFDTRYDCPRSAPKMPPTWRPGSFTRPRLRDGRALPLEAVERIGHMLAFARLDVGYAGLADVKAVCDPRSLAELAWDAARAWETGGARNADAWMIDSIAHLGDDVVMRRTTPAIKHPRITTVLANAATDAAAVELCTIAWRAAHEKKRRPYGARSGVEEAFTTLARRRNVTVEQVEDSLMPSIALTYGDRADVPVSSRRVSLRAQSIEARVKLDYGARTIEVGFDERLDPFVEGVRGRLRELPRAGKKDDPEKVALAQEVWRELQEDVAAIADVRLGSLARAMVTARPWTLDAFRHAWIEHPLMRHLSRGVVWRASRTFRVAEDGTFADVNDKPLHVAADGEPITVAHPAEMTDDELRAWQRVLVDYRIVQPLEQLSRYVLHAVQGMQLELVPRVPLRLPEFHERLRAARFEIGWRGSEQTAIRNCARTPHRLRIVLGVEDKSVVRLPLSAELSESAIDLQHVHPVDISELAHDLALALPQNV